MNLPDVKVNLSFGGGVRRITFKIIGMHCATCSLTVQRALLSVPGVLAADVSLAADEAVVDPGRVRYIDLVKAIERAGYDIYREEATLGMTPFPPFGWGFTVGVLGVTPSLGVNGFVLGVVIRVGYRPTGSSNVGKPPLGGTTPSTKHPNKTEAYKPTAMKPTQQNNPALKGKACHAMSRLDPVTLMLIGGQRRRI
ncbi:MAG: heavy metal-associated domain-containing protein [Caldivirga sp.]